LTYLFSTYLTIDNQPANDATNSKLDAKPDDKVQQKRVKRKGPKPSSKKRLEDFRLQKSRDTMADIHKAALERTSISVDKLISCLSEMQVIAQKQEVVVPITTRGVGFLVNESYQEAVSACPKACGTCSDVAAYRVCLAQQQVQLVKSDREASLNDPYVEKLQHVECNTISTTLLEQASSTPQSFRLTADFVNSIGKFEHQGTSYRPIVMSPYIGGVSERSGDSDFPDPYAVTFKNLRATVVALADEQTPVEARRHFIANNPLLGATWNADKLLNPNHIIPADYGVAELARA